jgi:Outer membrane protein beta-barrel domain
MSTSHFAVSTIDLDSIASLRRAARRALSAALVVSLVAASAVSARAQTPGGVTTGAPGAGGTFQGQGFEIRPFVGAYIPTGAQRDLLKDAVLVGAQASYRVIPQLAITGSFGWSPSKDRITPGDPTLDLFQYDVGAEARGAGWVRGDSWDFTPFVGLGVGGRTYNYRDLDVGSKTDFDGYGALGGDLNFGQVGLRIEGRDYVSQFKPLTGTGDAKTRNDVALAAGLNVRF